MRRLCGIAVAQALLMVCGGIAPCADVAGLIESRCAHCHDSSDSESGLDLTALTAPQENQDQGRLAELWARAEKMVAAGKMPPANEEPLADHERKRILDWYRDRYVLRDGRPHLGITPLRRLTRYELENTLEDLLAVQLKQPYVFSSESAGLEPSTIEQLYPADAPGESGFDNDAERLRQVKVPMLKLMACLDFALRKFDQDAAARRQVLGFEDKPKILSRERAEQILQRFMDRAFRGHDNQQEREAVLRVWQLKSREAPAYEALLHGMKAALLSPGFVYRLEHSRDLAEPYRVGGPELAVRLSYFLWSTMPDAALRAAAADGSLLSDEGLEAQVARMLNSPKRLALAENFAGQWLGFDELQRNKVFYAGENWTRGAYDELLFTFDELIRSDRPILEIVDADWAYLRSGAARGAGAKRHQLESKYDDVLAPRRRREGLKVERFYSPPQLYRVPPQRLGGMLTAAGIMRLTSAPNRTNPIRRGVWLLENIIGEEMRPPENIPPLAEAEKKVSADKAGSPAEILKVHTAQESCRACHQHIDPLGLGLENFAPNGDWRTAYPDNKPIASSGVLPNGRKFTTPKQLKQELLACYQEQIVDNIIRKLLSYALGRRLRPYDRPTVERIHQQLQKNDYRMGVLIREIVLSRAFRCRQDRI